MGHVHEMPYLAQMPAVVKGLWGTQNPQSFQDGGFCWTHAGGCAWERGHGDQSGTEAPGKSQARVQNGVSGARFGFSSALFPLLLPRYEAWSSTAE